MASAPPIYDPGKPAAPTPLPQRDPAAFGSDLAAGLSDVGRAVDHAATAAQATAYAVGDAGRQTAMSGAYQELQGMPRPGGAGFVDDVGKKFDALYGSVPLPRDPELANRARVQLAQDRARWMGQAQSWEAEQRGAATIDNLDQAGSAYAADLHDSAPIGNPAAARAALDAANAKTDTMIGATAGLHPDAALKIGRVQRAANGTALVNGLIDRGDLPGAAELLGSGALAGTVPPEHIQVLRSRLDTEQRRVEAQARAAASLGKAQAEQQIEITLKRVGDGVEVPQAELDQAHALAGQYGLATKDYDIGVARQRQSVNIVTRPMRPEDLQHNIDALAAKQADGTASAADQVTLDQLRRIAPARTAQFNADPGAWAAANGNPAPPIHLEDPASLQARGDWARGVARAANRPWVPLLSPTEAAPLLESAAHGQPQEQYSAARTVGTFGGYAPDVLRQVAPNDARFQAAAQLGTLPDHGQTMRDAFLGADAIRANANLLVIPKEQRTVLISSPDQAYHTVIGDALRLLPPSYQVAVLENGRNIYAARATRGGLASWDGNVFTAGIQSALGGVRDSATGKVLGGIGAWNGNKLLLPVGMSQSEFDMRLSRSSGAELVAAARGGHAPVFAGNMRPVTPPDLRAMVPTAVGDGVYAFRSGANTYLQASDGGRFELDIRKVRH